MVAIGTPYAPLFGVRVLLGITVFGLLTVRSILLVRLLSRNISAVLALFLIHSTFMKIDKETLATIVRIIRDICISVLAALGGSAMLSSCGVTTRATVRAHDDSTTSISISVTSPQNFSTSVADSTTLKIN